PVVHAAVGVPREIARVPRHQIVEPPLARPARYTASRDRLEHRPEQRHDVDLQHQSSAPQSTRITRPATSTCFTTWAMNGISRSRPLSFVLLAASTSNTSFAPVSMTRD